jgi:Ca-activated chloride channel family protein
MFDKGNVIALPEWLSLQWFQWDTVKTFHWENPLLLYTIPLIPALFFLRWLFHFRFRQKLQIALYSNNVKSKGIIQLLRLIPFTVVGIALAFFIVALARPQKETVTRQQWSEGIDILMVLDVSESMKLRDMHPDRLESSKEVMSQFIDKRPFDRFGLIIFAGNAYTYCPLTADHHMIKKMLANTNTNMIRNQGTAIGVAIGVGINRLIQSSSKTKVMLLISDGENTSGILDPGVAAKLAYEKGIKIYSFSVGKEGSVAFGKNDKGKTLYAYSQPDDQTLKEIATITGGKFYKVTSKKIFTTFLQELDGLEKSEITILSGSGYEDLYRIYLYWGLIFFLLWNAIRFTFLNNYLED